MKFLSLAALALLSHQTAFAAEDALKEKCRSLAYGAGNVKYRIAQEQPELFAQCNEVNFLQLKVSTKARSAAEKSLLRKSILGAKALSDVNYRIVDTFSEGDTMSVEAVFDSAKNSCSVRMEIRAGGVSSSRSTSKSSWGMNASACVSFVNSALLGATQWVELPVKLRAP